MPLNMVTGTAKDERKFEAAVKAVGKVMGFDYTGNDILGEAVSNPRLAHWCAIAEAAIKAYQKTK